MNEDDTFRILSRLPFHDMLNLYEKRYLINYNHNDYWRTRINFFKCYNWTIKEFFDTWQGMSDE